ncbi:CsgG/HfaB family protein [Paraglaciecola sp. 2405UD69-4]|uniref:CsgG/HfaB family protein n=1 Tax=Paraglaciecola sp. 2405UD69-4 TaxID=3391836 RepID=UPI0039C97E56
MMDYFKNLLRFELSHSLFFAALISTLTISQSTYANPSIAVIDFDRSSIRYPYLSQEISNLISDQLVNYSQFIVVERERLKSVMGEINLSSSGLVATNQVIQIGKLTGAEFLLTGQILNADIDKKTFSGYGVRTTKETYYLGISIRILDTQTGTIVFSDSQQAEHTLQDTQNRSNRNRTFIQLAEQLSNSFVSKINQSNRFKVQQNTTPSTVSVEVQSTPEEADVEVDGVFYGNAGDSLSLPTGMHTVKISLPGFDAWEKKVLIKENLSIKAKLRKSADFRIESNN